MRLWVEKFCHKKCAVHKPSASSWGCELKNLPVRTVPIYQQSASSWGCELKRETVYSCHCPSASASSWGCELKFLKNFEGIICIVVSLFVRLWVEMLWYPAAAYSESSASSWGCELKYINIVQSDHTSGQPLREAVSWNNGTQINQSPTIVSLFVRLWVEMLQT